MRVTADPPLTSTRQQGVALIAVLLLLVFILTIVGGLFYRHQMHIQKVTRSLMGEQAELFLLSAESWAKSVLDEDARNSTTDHLNETWARNLPVLPIEGGHIAGCLVDLQGRFNLNSLAWYTSKSWEDEMAADQLDTGKTTRRRILANLMALLEMDSADYRIAALVDWLDADSWLVSPDSAEDNEYLLQTPPYRAANHSFTELTELSLVQGFGPADVFKLQPWVNIIAEEVGINVNTAPPLIFMALLPYLSERQVEALIATRPFETVDEFYTTLATVTGETRQTLVAKLPAEFLGVGSRYFSLQATAELAGVRMAYNSVIRRDSDGRAKVLSRLLRHLPPVDEAGMDASIFDTGCQSMGEATATE